MKSLTNRIAIIALLLAAVVPAAADLPAPTSNNRKASPTRPDTTAGKTSMSVVPAGTASEARLEIPRSVLSQLTAEIDRDDSQPVVAAGTVFSMGNTQTVLAGLFLSLAFGFGGVWFVRSRKAADKPTRAALGIAVVAFCGASATIAYGNAGPPPVARSLTSKILVQAAQSGAYGEVKVVIVEQGNSIKLILPKQ